MNDTDLSGDPTPEQIAAACQAIRQTWSEAEHRRRVSEVPAVSRGPSSPALWRALAAGWTAHEKAGYLALLHRSPPDGEGFSVEELARRTGLLPGVVRLYIRLHTRRLARFGVTAVRSA